jgi:small-conductance mechanosensitive channel
MSGRVQMRSWGMASADEIPEAGNLYIPRMARRERSGSERKLLRRRIAVLLAAHASMPLTGTIEGLGLGLSLRYTSIRADDRRRIIMPNSTIASQVTINLNDVTSP